MVHRTLYPSFSKPSSSPLALPSMNASLTNAFTGEAGVSANAEKAGVKERDQRMKPPCGKELSRVFAIPLADMALTLMRYGDMVEHFGRRTCIERSRAMWTRIHVGRIHLSEDTVP